MNPKEQEKSIPESEKEKIMTEPEKEIPAAEPLLVPDSELPIKIRQELTKYIQENKIPKAEQQRLIDSVKTIYAKTMYEPQEAVGVVTAQSLSEPATQMTMRTYHFAGTAGIQVTLGLPRILEIFDARKEPRTPTMTIFIQPDYQSIEEVKKIAKNVKEIKTKDIVTATTLDLTDLLIRCKLNKQRLSELKIDTEKLPKIVKIRNVVIEISGNEMIISPKKKDIASLHALKYTLLESHIKGIKGITQVVITKEGSEWIISTLGSNLKKVFEIDGIDTNRTMTNNIFEIQDILGIEAARVAIIKQANYTMEEQGLNVDIRYIMLLADLMTVSGKIRAIGRYGIAGQKASVLVRASFEETKKHLIAATIKKEKDPMLGTIENIMVNQVAPIGTGVFDLIGSIPRKKRAEPKKKPKK